MLQELGLYKVYIPQGGDIEATLESAAHPEASPFATEAGSDFLPPLLGLDISLPRLHLAGR